MRKIMFIFFLFSTTILKANDSTVIRVHFLYGSVPAKDHPEEKKWFGGKHGGHVTIEVNGFVFGFNPKGRYHYFPHRNNKHAVWIRESSKQFYRDTVDMRYVIFEIPVSTQQHHEVDSILNYYHKNMPHDYSLLGFRCASSTWEVLEKTGILKQHSDLWKAWVIFYPRRIRKRFFSISEQKEWKIMLKEGGRHRIWEKDKRNTGFH